MVSWRFFRGCLGVGRALGAVAARGWDGAASPDAAVGTRARVPAHAHRRPAATLHQHAGRPCASVPPPPTHRPGAGAYQDAGKTGKCIVLKTSTRQTIFLPVAGLVEPEVGGRVGGGGLVGAQVGDREGLALMHPQPSCAHHSLLHLAWQALKPGDLVGVNKDSYLILDTLPAEYDSR